MDGQFSVVLLRLRNIGFIAGCVDKIKAYAAHAVGPGGRREVNVAQQRRRLIFRNWRHAGITAQMDGGGVGR